MASGTKARSSSRRASVTTWPEPATRWNAANAFAVSYLRVSTKEQAEKGGQAEGFSIPAQREANQRKADQLGATIIEEFVDAGESARKADRPELMRMVQYVAKHKTNYCIVHKVDRLARNRADDVTIHLALKDAGVTLVSATENIDETPSGMLLHGIMSSIAEFYSRNLANEVIKGTEQKVQNGGTPTLAPLGYLNTREVVNGREDADGHPRPGTGRAGAFRLRDLRHRRLEPQPPGP